MEENRYMKIESVDGFPVDENGRINIVALDAAKCDSEIRSYFEHNRQELRDQREEILAKLSDLYSSDEYAGSSIEDRAGMENRDEIRDLKLKLWEIRRRSLILNGASKFFPANHSGAAEYFNQIKRDAGKRLIMGIPTDSTPKEITEFLAAGIEIDVAGDMLEALATESK